MTLTCVSLPTLAMGMDAELHQPAATTIQPDNRMEILGKISNIIDKDTNCERYLDCTETAGCIGTALGCLIQPSFGVLAFITYQSSRLLKNESKLNRINTFVNSSLKGIRN